MCTLSSCYTQPRESRSISYSQLVYMCVNGQLSLSAALLGWLCLDIQPSPRICLRLSWQREHWLYLGFTVSLPLDTSALDLRFNPQFLGLGSSVCKLPERRIWFLFQILALKAYVPKRWKCGRPIDRVREWWFQVSGHVAG